ncbi:IS3 family transposase, partial [Sulfurimonas sp. SAG-AH-194-I05]|nr:IS3 family transposase [Sulfurimonas sp. SAG-AH-194-I05]
MKLVNEAHACGASILRISSIVGYSTRTIKRWRIKRQDKRSIHSNHNPSNKLSDEERKALIAVANNQEYKNLSPHQIVP